jgi:hypothetical protein
VGAKNQKMRDLKQQHNCNPPGALLLMELLSDEIPVPETAVVIIFLFQYANVVAGQGKLASQKSCTRIFQ